MSRFRRIKGLNMSYERQGLIFFALANYASQPPSTRAQIDALFSSAAKGEPAYNMALRAWLLRGESWEKVQQEYYVNGKTLVKMRKWIYTHW